MTPTDPNLGLHPNDPARVEPPICRRCEEYSDTDRDICSRCQLCEPLDRVVATSAEGEKIMERLQWELEDLFDELSRHADQMRAAAHDPQLPCHHFWADELDLILRKRRL